MTPGRFVMTSEPAPCPRACQVSPPSLVAQSPAVATPAIIKSSSGFPETYVRLPHSDGLLARFAVTLTQSPGGSGPRPIDPVEPAEPDEPDEPELLLPAAPLEPLAFPLPVGQDVTNVQADETSTNTNAQPKSASFI